MAKFTAVKSHFVNHTSRKETWLIFVPLKLQFKKLQSMNATATKKQAVKSQFVEVQFSYSLYLISFSEKVISL